MRYSYRSRLSRIQSEKSCADSETGITIAHTLLACERTHDLEWAGKRPRRACLSTLVEKDIDIDWDDDAENLDDPAHTERCISIGKPLQQRAALL